MTVPLERGPSGDAGLTPGSPRRCETVTRPGAEVRGVRSPGPWRWGPRAPEGGSEERHPLPRDRRPWEPIRGPGQSGLRQASRATGQRPGRGHLAARRNQHPLGGGRCA